MFLCPLAILLVLFPFGGMLDAQEKVAIIIREGSSYSAPYFPQVPNSRLLPDAAFRVHEEKIDPKGRVWLQISDGAEKKWVLKNLCIVRHFADWERVRPFIQQVRSQAWSNGDKERVLKGVVDVSMPPEQVLLSWGEPMKILTQSQHEEWDYGPIGLVFRAGVVAEIRFMPIHSPSEPKQ
jgi:hypothetical protein